MRRVPWADLGVGAAVFAAGFVEMSRTSVWAGSSALPALTFLVLLSGAVGCYRKAPGIGLALVWMSSALQIDAGAGVMITQLSVLLLAYGAARFGRWETVWLSGLSIPAGCVIGAWYVVTHGETWRVGLGNLAVLYRVGLGDATPLVLAGVLGLTLLAAPWVVGLVLRLSDVARRSRQDRERAREEAARAQEIASLRAEQARLARDVHDVVGHSLTVILAQADSAQFMPDSDIEKIRATLGNISASARKSLGDVRQVLTTTGDDTTSGPAAVGELDSLVDGVRAAGNDVRDHVEGDPRPLPPELDVVAFRVLQEMLTNALKHGLRATPITVHRAWDQDDLRIEVRNVPDDRLTWNPAEGLGVAGMRRRLESVGGRLDVGRHESEFVATAWVPTRPRGA
ncbi:MAG TPA: histidine kinase [Jiangellaceae bacterium]